MFTTTTIVDRFQTTFQVHIQVFHSAQVLILSISVSQLESLTRSSELQAKNCVVVSLQPLLIVQRFRNCVVVSLQPLVIVQRFRKCVVVSLQPLVIVQRFRKCVVVSLQPLVIVQRFRKCVDHWYFLLSLNRFFFITPKPYSKPSWS